MNKRLLKELYASYVFFWLLVTSRVPMGQNVFEKEWDYLLILDACRFDAMQEVEEEYGFIEEVESIWSIGSTSKEWIEQTFVESYKAEIADTAYITGNPFSNTLLGERERTEYGSTHSTWLARSDWPNTFIKDRIVLHEDFGHIEPLWGSTGKDAPFEASQMPSSVTNNIITAARSGSYNRIVGHYMQPHSPYFASSKEYDELKEYEKNPFKALKNGNNEDEVWDAYLDNLRFVLDSVETLLNNVDGKVVITADHGELLGENGMYYHMPANPHPKLKKVPWVQTQGQDNHTVEPEKSLDGIDGNQSISENQLEALGYL